ncbi:MAG: DUF3179 domain-containing (seleno)protein, partial [Cyclobacteriaceae bacterium]
LIGIEIVSVYYIMPFPGSQVDEMVEVAYFIQNYIWIFRIAGLLLIAYPAFSFLRGSNPYFKWTAAVLLFFWIMVFYNVNFRFQADKIFYQPESKILVAVDKNKIAENQLVIGVSINGKAKAYPIEVIGYHHQVRDTIGGEEVMITYCTVCRTGRVYSPVVDGKVEEFRLAGMDHFNAMFEDSRTKSWWRQANGEAIVGPSKGKALKEVPSEQMSLSAWLARYPYSLILQPDSVFKDQYKDLEKYDEGTIKGKLEGRDSLSWKDKSWVVGIPMGLFAKAYDWNDLMQFRAINDKVGKKPIVLVLDNDSTSFHAWSRIVLYDTLQFIYSDSLKTLTDQNTQSVWDWSGKCTNGKLKGMSLEYVQSYQEFWHSWRQFHPQTEKYSTKPLAQVPSPNP